MLMCGKCCETHMRVGLPQLGGDRWRAESYQANGTALAINVCHGKRYRGFDHGLD